MVGVNRSCAEICDSSSYREVIVQHHVIAIHWLVEPSGRLTDPPWR
jgi:hypothetical protein